MSENGGGALFVSWVRARARSRAMPEGTPDDIRTAIFREHCVGVDEGDTASYAKACVEREGVARPLALKRGVKP